MLANIWRFLCALADWRTILRKLFGRPVINTVFVTNMRDDKDRQNFLGGWSPPEGHFNGPRYWLNGLISGRTRAMNLTAEEMVDLTGRRLARKKSAEVIQWAGKQGANVILFAAGTKHLFEGDHKFLTEKFPKMVFTIGDNGTMLLLRKETLRALDKSVLIPGISRIAVLGPYGILGEMMVRTLKTGGFDIIGAGPNEDGLEKVRKKYDIRVCRDFYEMGKVDAVVACTHSENIRLNSDNIDLIRRNYQKLLVIDVAEPSNLTYKEYQKCKDRVIRQDAGNAYAPGLKYVLGAISYKMFRLTQGVTFGCFAEAMALSWALGNGHREEVLQRNWLEVDDEKMEYCAKLFEELGFQIPSPRCFSSPVKSFDLNLDL